MENDNETKWNKKKSFSDSSNNIDENFQTINMVQKIKKAKKQKGILNVENFKNIEILQNIYDVSNNEIPKEDLTNKETNVEAFNINDYDGIDRIKDPVKDDSVKYSLINFIDKMFDKIDKFNYSKAKWLASVFSKKTETNSDVIILKKYIALFETIGFSYFVTYNWFFYMFYKIKVKNEDTQQPSEERGETFISGFMDKINPFKKEEELTDDNSHYERPVQPQFSRKSISEASRTWIVLDLYTVFFDFIIIYTEYFQALMTTILPFLGGVFNNKTSFILLFLSFIYIIFNYLTTLRSIILSALNMDFKNLIVAIMFIVLLVVYLPSAWFPAKSNRESDISSAAAKQSFIGNSIYILFPFVIWRLLRGFVTLLITIPMGAFLLTSYFVFFSLFGVTSYYYFNPVRTYKEFMEMYMYIKKSKSPLEGNKNVDDLNYLERFLIIMNNFMESLHRYILYIAYLVMFIVGLFDYYYNIDSLKLKENMVIISFILIIVCLTLCFAGFISHGMNDENFKII